MKLKQTSYLSDGSANKKLHSAAITISDGCRGAGLTGTNDQTYSIYRGCNPNTMKRGDQMVNIRDLRESAGMTQQELADACGLVRQTITAYETGQIDVTHIPVQTAMKLGAALDCDWKEFYEN